MRIDCPLCGSRDRREFYYQGDAVALARPAPEANEAAWDGYVHLRDNPAGPTRELWHHEAGCSAWLVVTRDTVSHEISDVALAADAKEAGA
ncbi:Sarcosine oxidase, delta subunit family [Sulfitobacter sp. THAF37]|uniref:sarcosine oxidase subunit delta n=1 Tax=Sulfitobacter sp. THAF37 TaxID=2587855 RepID=UPI0012680F33|nr:sarcosine oxidase subunit delta [Sulfitobacter sp. THAF37]QFT59257.1 Sarcosine oxidase, delta subunit family [Sulfitobacter sp. THAF37]